MQSVFRKVVTVSDGDVSFMRIPADEKIEVREFFWKNFQLHNKDGKVLTLSYAEDNVEKQFSFLQK